MSVHTILLDFSIDADRIKAESGQKEVIDDIVNVLNEQSSVGKLKSIVEHRAADSHLAIYETSDNVVATIRLFSEKGLITLNLEYYKGHSEPAKFDFDSLRAVERTLVKRLNFPRGHTIPPISRGSITKYFPTSDERIIEYDIDKVLFEQHSPYQKVQIVHSKSLGNMLVLDELQNLAEADLIYTETLMMRGTETYEGKDICILGGGDGGLLYEMLKERPNYVAMLEIDEMVMEACNEHMRSVCGDVLEKRSGDNYDIIVGDCMAALDKYIKSGRQFDYVFGDLTDIPLNEAPTGEIWEFIRSILEASFKVLKPNGKFMTHGNGSSCPDSLRMYEAQLKKLEPPVEFTMSKAFVPSFMEEWNFYQVFRAQQNNV